MYTFHIQAANNDGLWNDIGAEIQFRILPPFYRRWWFLLLALFTLIWLSMILYRVRVQRLQLSFEAVLAERNRIAREIHDTLAQDFVGVSLQLDLVSQLLARSSLPEAASQVKATRSLVNEGLAQARQSIWNLRANSTKDGLPARVTALTQRFSSGDLVVKTKIGGAYRALPGAIEEEVLKIMQEALSNVRRHAMATVVNVQLTYGQDKLIVQLADNGRGFSIPDAAAKPGHFGLQGIRERAASLGTEINLTSSPDKGTTLEFVVPILKEGSLK
jgi:signal transduction histidine kinase